MFVCALRFGLRSPCALGRCVRGARRRPRRSCRGRADWQALARAAARRGCGGSRSTPTLSPPLAARARPPSRCWRAGRGSAPRPRTAMATPRPRRLRAPGRAWGRSQRRRRPRRRAVPGRRAPRGAPPARVAGGPSWVAVSLLRGGGTRGRLMQSGLNRCVMRFTGRLNPAPRAPSRGAPEQPT